MIQMLSALFAGLKAGGPVMELKMKIIVYNY